MSKVDISMSFSRGVGKSQSISACGERGYVSWRNFFSRRGNVYVGLVRTTQFSGAPPGPSKSRNSTLSFHALVTASLQSKKNTHCTRIK